MNNYIPNPIDTSQIDLPIELITKLEDIAKNVHDEWAKKRIDEGWKFGLTRDDNKKLHPGIRPYEELSETEKEYDKQTATSTIKMLIAMGYEIKTTLNNYAKN
nr:RyR domain-containing protein [uncultured Draconibacterium sp.]